MSEKPTSPDPSIQVAMREIYQKTMRFERDSIPEIIRWLNGDFFGVVNGEQTMYISGAEIEAKPEAGMRLVVHDSIAGLIRVVDEGCHVVLDPDLGYLVFDDETFTKRYVLAEEEKPE